MNARDRYLKDLKAQYQSLPIYQRETLDTLQANVTFRVHEFYFSLERNSAGLPVYRLYDCYGYYMDLLYNTHIQGVIKRLLGDGKSSFYHKEPIPLKINSPSAAKYPSISDKLPIATVSQFACYLALPAYYESVYKQLINNEQTAHITFRILQDLKDETTRLRIQQSLAFQFNYYPKPDELVAVWFTTDKQNRVLNIQGWPLDLALTTLRTTGFSKAPCTVLRMDFGLYSGYLLSSKQVTNYEQWIHTGNKGFAKQSPLNNLVGTYNSFKHVLGCRGGVVGIESLDSYQNYWLLTQLQELFTYLNLPDEYKVYTGNAASTIVNNQLGYDFRRSRTRAIVVYKDKLISLHSPTNPLPINDNFRFSEIVVRENLHRQVAYRIDADITVLAEYLTQSFADKKVTPKRIVTRQ